MVGQPGGLTKTAVSVGLFGWDSLFTFRWFLCHSGTPRKPRHQNGAGALVAYRLFTSRRFRDGCFTMLCPANRIEIDSTKAYQRFMTNVGPREMAPEKSANATVSTRIPLDDSRRFPGSARLFSKRDPRLSKPGFTICFDGPAHGETQAPLWGGGCFTAGGRPCCNLAWRRSGFGLAAKSSNAAATVRFASRHEQRYRVNRSMFSWPDRRFL